MSDKSDLKAELERKKQRLAQIREEKKRKEEERKKKEVCVMSVKVLFLFVIYANSKEIQSGAMSIFDALYPSYILCSPSCNSLNFNKHIYFLFSL